MICTSMPYQERETLMSIIVIGIVASLIFIYVRTFRPKLSTLDVPLYNGKLTDRGIEFQSAIIEGSLAYPNDIFKLATSNHDTIILPFRYIDEIKSVSSDKLNLTSELYERQLGLFTMVGRVGHIPGFVDSIRFDLNKNLTSTLPTLLDEVSYAVNDSFAGLQDWTPIKVYPKALRMVALLTGRVFVGLPLSRNESWIETSIELTTDTFDTAFALWNFHWALRPLAAVCMRKFWNIRRQTRTTANLLRPFMEHEKSVNIGSDQKKHFSLLSTLLDNVAANDVKSQAELHASLNVAALHTTSMNITHIIYDLASQPDSVEMLRQEAEQVFAEANGDLDKNTMNKLRKMDSFMRESQRLNPPGIVSLSRKVVNDTTLSDGTRLPAGCLVACDSWSATRDQRLWHEPEKFDGLRFEKLRSLPGNDTKFQFVTTSPTNMPFGHGSHSCPGRFFVANEIKILMSYIIMHYDIKLKPNHHRPTNSHLNIMLFPDFEAEILFRRRRTY